MKKIASFFMAMVWAAAVWAQTPATQKHEIQSGETLYSIARQYNVSVADLLQLNPGLQADVIMAGQRINVPATTQQSVVQTPQQQTQVPVQSSAARPKYKTYHEVQKKETIYSISHQYGITESQLIEANPTLKNGKLKKGVVLNIPYTMEEVRKEAEARRQREEEAQKPKVQMYSTIKVAVILPFSLVEQNMTTEAQKMTNLYQGFLLAVDSLKQRGYSVEIFAYDEAVSDDTFNRILTSPAMSEMQLIIGPVRPYHIAPVAQFANTHGIAHVVPLSNEPSLVEDRPTLFQINVPYSVLYSQVYNRFVVSHREENIVFVSMNDRGDNQAYISGFKAALNDMGLAYKSAAIEDPTTIQEALSETGRNVIIPTSGSQAAFENLCKKLEHLTLSEQCQIQLFGFPEWQTFASRHEKNFSKYRCQFFSSFYSNTGSLRTQQFNSRFRRWFNQDQYSSFPRYGEMGYDIGVYFLKGLHDYGSAFRENLHNFSYFSLEFPFSFEKKSPTSGFQNRSLFFVTYRTDGTVSVR